jgi:hypothetical protein
MTGNQLRFICMNAWLIASMYVDSVEKAVICGVIAFLMFLWMLCK